MTKVALPTGLNARVNCPYVCPPMPPVWDGDAASHPRLLAVSTTQVHHGSCRAGGGNGGVSGSGGVVVATLEMVGAEVREGPTRG